MVFTFYNTFLNLLNISSLFSSEIIIFPTFLGFSSGLTILSMLDLVTASAILFPKIQLLYRLLFWKQFLMNLFLYPIIAFLFPCE